MNILAVVDIEYRVDGVPLSFLYPFFVAQNACTISHSITVLTLQIVPSSLHRSDIAPHTFTDYGREKIVSTGFTAQT